MLNSNYAHDSMIGMTAPIRSRLRGFLYYETLDSFLAGEEGVDPSATDADRSAGSRAAASDVDKGDEAVRAA